jgi:DNA polymerase III psi subunit
MSLEEGKIAIPLPKGYKLIVIVSNEASDKSIFELKAALRQFNQSNDTNLIVREELIKQIYLVEQAELKKE